MHAHTHITCRVLPSLVHPIQTLQQAVHLGFDLTEFSFDGVQLLGSHWKEKSMGTG